MFVVEISEISRSQAEKFLKEIWTKLQRISKSWPKSDKRGQCNSIFQSVDFLSFLNLPAESA